MHGTRVIGALMAWLLTASRQQGDPLILGEHRAPVEDFGLSYIKGLSRVSALHLLLTMVRDDGVSLQKVPGNVLSIR